MFVSSLSPFFSNSFFLLPMKRGTALLLNNKNGAPCTDALTASPAAIHNPTNPDSAADSTSTNTNPHPSTPSVLPPSSTVDPSLAPPASLPDTTSSSTNPTLGPAPGPGTTLGAAGGMGVGGGIGMGMGESNYEVFDPLNWMLDGLVDFPYFGHPGGLEAGGIT